MNLLQTISINALNNPFYNQQTQQINLPKTILISVGILFIIMGIAVFFLYPYRKKKAQEYKELQMQEYKNNHPRTKFTRYEQTGMYLPINEQFKKNLPIILGLTFIFIGISFLIGTNLSTL
ncbi:hypothetical protein V2E24_02795 [Mycoplasmopsis ciconiae]|uniref:Uncharacterized protein n=1 Tax=Mycoplasmopsis ciconiae TaxID=561067 RepID=A0ABU7MLY8_9BACT|nr:hypothetical protein [Mycoplasmopsis ciconiae]